MQTLKIVALSDPHGSLHSFEVPECDLLLIGGDVCPVDESHEVPHQRAWLRDVFSPWLAEQPAKEIVWIAGNHDFACEGDGFWRVAEEFPGHYLCDSSIEIDGVKIYGSPWVPNLPGWAFHAADPRFQELGDKYPDDADILLLHGPPKGILDSIPGWGGVGAPHVASAINRVMPKHVIFGHIHESYGLEKIGDVTFRNVAHMDEGYNPVNLPHVFHM